MNITREQVEDLREGDVVEYHRHDWPAGVYIRGPLHQGPSDWIGLGDIPIRFSDGQSNGWADREGSTLTVVSRAPRPLYVNHPRTEPVPGDVVRDADRPDNVVSWSRAVGGLGNHDWCYTGSATVWCASMPARLRLLVDGETGQVVP